MQKWKSPKVYQINNFCYSTLHSTKAYTISTYLSVIYKISVLFHCIQPPQYPQASLTMSYSQMVGNALWRLQVCVFTIPMGDGNPENIHLLKTSCNNLSETKSFWGHSASTVSLLGSTPVLFYFRLSLISPPVSEHSLRHWTENRRTEQGFRCLYARNKRTWASGKSKGAFYRVSVS